MTARALGLVLMLAAGAATAGERFYPVIGPDGRLQLLRSEAAPEEGEGAAVADSPAAAVAPEEGNGQDAADAPGFAPYDSDRYADSEAVERALQQEARERPRFYMVDDGLGIRVSENGGEADETAAVLAAPAAPPVAEREPYAELPSLYRQWSGAAARQQFPALARCLGEPERAALPLVAAGAPANLVLHKATYLFLAADRLVQGYRVGGVGPRTLVLRSYAQQDRRPAFAQPHLAFLDATGCLTRVVSGYGERLYPPNDARHAVLRGELLVHSDEAYVLLVAPSGSDEIATTMPYGYSPYGQLKLLVRN